MHHRGTERRGESTAPIAHLASLIATLAACSPGLAEETDASWAPSPVEAKAAEAIDEATLRAHTKFLAHDLLGGRAPGSRGDRLAQLYIRSHLQALGFAPGAPGGEWLQKVPLLGITTRMPETITFRAAQGDRGPNPSAGLRRLADYVLNGSGAEPRIDLADLECVFVGYGIVAPEYDWDDFKDADVAGKVLVIRNSDPSDDPALFAGETRLYYGRWDYKFETAARKGAVAAFIIHTTPSAAYPWQVVRTSWSGEQYELEGRSGSRLEAQGWLAWDAARRVFALGGEDLDGLWAAAERRDFQPVPLGVRLSAEAAVEVRKVETANVLGMLPGGDPERREEMVIYTAHHDHLGTAAESEEDPAADCIYNGALDNASGVAALLAIAKAYARLPERPARSLLFAAVAAEEQGLLGSAYLAEHPPVPPGELAAVLNVDTINIFGLTRDITLVGKGKSTLDGIVGRVAGWQGRVVKPDPFPDRGAFYRSDQFSLAKIGVPGVYVGTGTDFLGRPEGWGRRQIEEWIGEHYHQPSDEYRDDWNLAGAVEDVRLLFHVGLRVAEQEDLPAWAPGDEFEAPRRAALERR